MSQPSTSFPDEITFSKNVREMTVTITPKLSELEKLFPDMVSWGPYLVPGSDKVGLEIFSTSQPKDCIASFEGYPVRATLTTGWILT